MMNGELRVENGKWRIEIVESGKLRVIINHS
jgi:hypothetical protein